MQKVSWVHLNLKDNKLPGNWREGKTSIGICLDSLSFCSFCCHIFLLLHSQGPRTSTNHLQCPGCDSCKPHPFNFTAALSHEKIGWTCGNKAAETQCQQHNGDFSAVVVELPHNITKTTYEDRLSLDIRIYWSKVRNKGGLILHSQVGSVLHATSFPLSWHWMKWLPFNLYLSENTQERKHWCNYSETENTVFSRYPSDQKWRKGKFKASRCAHWYTHW